MATIIVDGNEHEVREDQNLLQAVLGLGYDLPYFCWHPALGSVGACRQCAVTQYRDADDSSGMIIMACMTPVSDGLRISLNAPEAVAFRSSVIEWLMTNHPHDCPVCDEGGECHLQDMTVMTGHCTRTHRFAKRTHRNQYLGPFLDHEMNRCIQCYRCVRFYRDYAGGNDLNVFGSRNRVYFGRFEDGPLESPFSGNLAEVCPTGVFTDKVFKARSVRKWDLQTAPSVCVHCSLGCNTLPGERHGVLRRIRNRYHGEINRYFLCDRGRFGFEFVNSKRRLRRPLIRDAGGETQHPATADSVIDRIARLLDAGTAIGVGSPTASLEANHALRALVGADHFFMGIDDAEAAQLEAVVEILRSGSCRTPSLRQVEDADAILILGEDLTNTAPLLDLAVRQAVLNVPKQRARALGVPDWNDAVIRLVGNRTHGPLFIATPYPTELDELAGAALRAAPQDIARLGFAVAAAVDPAAPTVDGLPADHADLAATVAAVLLDARAPLIIAGVGANEVATIHAAANIARALAARNPETALSLIAPSCNSIGAALLDAPSLDAAVARTAAGDTATAVVLEPEPAKRGRHELLTKLRRNVRHLVLLDQLHGPASALADIVLPAASFAESSGTLVNNEARAQRFFQVFVPQEEVRAGWRWLARIADAADRRVNGGWDRASDVTAALADAQPVFRPILDLIPEPTTLPGRRIPRQSHRVSGRTAATAHLDIREPQPPDDPDSPLAFSMEGDPRLPPAGLIARYWSPGWNSVQALTRFQQEVGGALRGGDPGARLFEPATTLSGRYFDDIPSAYEPVRDEWLVLSVHHIFGSDRLSMETAGVAELAPDPYIAVNPDDATELGISGGDTVELEIGGRTATLPARITPGLPRRCVGLFESLLSADPLPGGRRARLRRPS